ncbi:TetR/AcrR family transcriptional regulator [soil metagenome]
MTSTVASGQLGRSRSEIAQHRILESTRDELARRGYDKFSIDRVAKAAGVGKQTVYRHYPSKSALVAECILRGYLLTPDIETPDTGDVRHDIAQWALTFAELSRQPEAIAIALAGTAASAENGEIAARYHEQIVELTEVALGNRLRAGLEAGQLKPGTATSTVVEAIVGALLYRLLTRQPLTPVFVHELLDIIFDGIEA